MNKQKRFSWLLGLLVFLIIVAYATGVFDQAPSTVDVPKIEIDGSEIDRIVIEGDRATLEVDKSSGTWQMMSPVAWLADSVVISSFIRNLSDLRLETVVSRNPERYGRYGVDSTGASITVGFGDEQQQLIVSGDGPDYSTVYLRMHGDERVFIARPRLLPPSNASLWQDKLITSISPTSIAKIGVRTPETNFVIESGESGWMLESDGEQVQADSAAVVRWIGNFASFRSDGFLSIDTEIDGPTNILTFQLQSGETVNFHILERENDLALRYDREPRAVYKIFKSRQASLLPDWTTLSGGE